MNGPDNYAAATAILNSVKTQLERFEATGDTAEALLKSVSYSSALAQAFATLALTAATAMGSHTGEGQTTWAEVLK